MTDGTWIIRGDRDREFAKRAVDKAPLGRQVKIGKATRTSEQNALLHAAITDIAEQLIWPQPPRNDGEIHDVEWWKRRCTLGWLKDNKEMAEIVTGLDDDGTFAILLPHTSDLSIPQCASLVEWVFAFGAENGVAFKEKPKGEEPPDEAYEAYR